MTQRKTKAKEDNTRLRGVFSLTMGMLVLIVAAPAFFSGEVFNFMSRDLFHNILTSIYCLAQLLLVVVSFMDALGCLVQKHKSSALMILSIVGWAIFLISLLFYQFGFFISRNCAVENSPQCPEASMQIAGTTLLCMFISIVAMIMICQICRKKQ